MELVGQLTGGIAHDFNNMLTVITGTIEILADGVKHDPALASIAKMINDAADRGVAAHGQPAGLRQEAAAAAARDRRQRADRARWSNLLAPTLGRQIEIDTALSDEAWPALVDRSQLTSALVNLAINARDAMPDGGHAAVQDGQFHPPSERRGGGRARRRRLRYYRGASTAALEFRLAIRDRIFEPFFSTKQFGTGTGLGLSMVFGFAKQSGGAVVVDGEEGKGACFRIYLPKADVEPSDAFAPSNALAGGRRTTARRFGSHPVRRG